MIRELVDKVDRLQKGFDSAFGETVELADETRRTDESRRPKIGLFEAENAKVDSDKDLEERDYWEVADIW